MNRSLALLILGFSVLFLSCDRDFSDPGGDEMARFNAWIQVNNIPADTKKSSGLYFVTQTPGTGISPQTGDWVLYSYTEKTLDGLVWLSDNSSIVRQYDRFDKNYHYTPVFTKYYVKSYPATISGYSREMLKGVFEGLGYMKEGEKATLYIPFTLAYGSRSASNGLGYQSLIYELELLKVIKDPRAYEQSLIDSYIAQNYPGLQPINDSIYYVQLAPPTADTVTLAKDSIAYVYYKGMFLDGFVFDTNIDSVAKRLGRQFSSNDSLKVTIGGRETIKGFSQALINMKKGEWGRAIIPSFCGYDSIGTNNIPPFTPLIFDIYFSSKGKVTSKPK